MFARAVLLPGLAALRGTAKGTVRARTAAIWGKAGVDGRARLLGLLMEELLADDGPITGVPVIGGPVTGSHVTGAPPTPPARDRSGRPARG